MSSANGIVKNNSRFYIFLLMYNKIKLDYAFLISITINICFLILCVVLCEPHFGALDDYFMAAVLGGAHGVDYNVHMYFVNAIFGYVLLPFYQLFPKIGWYYIAEMFGVFLSFNMVSYVLVKKLGCHWGALLAVVLLVCMGNPFYVNVQFTQCAALFSATGMLYLLCGINENKCWLLFLGGVVFFWGTLMRFEAFLMGMPFLMVTLLVQFKVCLKRWKQLLLTTSLLVIIVFGAHYFDQKLYETSEYRPYKTFQGPRSALGDGNNYNKGAVFEDLEESGKYGEDYEMLVQWKFYDTEVFAVDSLRQILSYTYKYRNGFNSLGSPLNILSALSGSITRFTSLIFFVFGIIILLTNPNRGTYPWLALLMVVFLIAYLMYINRLVLRVENGFWLYASILAIPHFGKLREIPHKFVYALIAFLALVGCYNLSLNEIPEKKQATYDQIFEYIEQNSNTIFLLPMFQYAAFAEHKLPPYLAEPIGGFRRTICYGYWTSYLPEITKTLNEFNISNPMKDVVRENVVVIGDGNLGDFLQRHYYDSVKVDTIKKIDHVKFFKYSVVK